VKFKGEWWDVLRGFILLGVLTAATLFPFAVFAKVGSSAAWIIPLSIVSATAGLKSAAFVLDWMTAE
jgi:uncharacterized membrane protein YeiB